MAPRRDPGLRSGNREALRPTLRERNKAAARAEIAEVALRLFMDEGYEEVTLERIAAGSGVSIRTVMRYFRSKEDLAFAHYRDLFANFPRRLRDPQGQEDTISFWRRNAARYAAELDERADWWKRWLTFVESVPALKTRFLGEQQRFEEMLCDALAEEAGTDEPSLGHRVLAAALVYGNFAVSRHARLTKSPATFVELCDSVITLIRDGLAVKVLRPRPRKPRRASRA